MPDDNELANNPAHNPERIMYYRAKQMSDNELNAEITAETSDARWRDVCTAELASRDPT